MTDSVKFDGKDLFDGAIQGNRSFREEVFSETQGSWMIRTDRWKLTKYKTGEGELYDLANDPGEHGNLYSRPEAAHVITDLAQRLARWRVSGV